MEQCIRENCWCKKLEKMEKNSNDQFGRIVDEFHCIDERIRHLYDGVEKCFGRIEDIENARRGDAMMEITEFLELAKKVEKLHALRLKYLKASRGLDIPGLTSEDRIGIAMDLEEIGKKIVDVVVGPDKD